MEHQAEVGQQQPAGESLPVSIIIPCRNEARFIERCLGSVFAFEAPLGSFEVIVVDGLSSDGTREILERWTETHPNLRVLDNPGKIVPTGMNTGIRSARGQLIVRLDAHSEYPPDYLRMCVETSRRTGAENVGGVFLTRPRGKSAQARLVQALTTHRFGVGNAEYRLDAEQGPADTVPYGCFRREVFERIGGYDERLVRNQDYELNQRILQSGGRVWRNPAIRVFYYNQGTLRGLLRQACFTGQWNPWMWCVAPYAFTARHTIPGLFAVAALGAAALALASPWGMAALGMVLVPYLTLALVASWQQARRHEWWMALPLPLLFLAYHLAYGSGILWGALRLLVRRTPVQARREPWPGAGRFRAWPA